MAPEDLSGARVTVVGGARSGVAAATLLARFGADVFVTDAGEIESAFSAELSDAGVPFESMGHSDRAIEADLVVISPGVPDSAPIVRDIQRRGIPIYSEIEAASWFCRAPVVAITGSNGKTTTASLLGHVFRSAGFEAVVGGNIGYPFSSFAADVSPQSIVVLEVSSFQLDHIDTFRPRVSVLLNITPDHLDRYDHKYENYIRSKFRVFENQEADDTYIFNHDDPVVRPRSLALMQQRPSPAALGFSLETELDRGAFVRDGELIIRINEEESLMREEELTLQGKHNLYNSLAAAMAARVMEVGSEAVRQSLMTFEGVPHRLEFVREVDGVRYVNDSKATNVNAVWYALESFREPVVLILGGRDKGNDYGSLVPLIRKKTRGIVAIGESRAKIIDELGDVAPTCMEADSMEEAVRLASALARPGDVVLLSPACASFDMFENYEHRGDVFRQAVNEL